MTVYESRRVLVEPMQDMLDAFGEMFDAPDGRWPLLRTGEREPIPPPTRRLVLDRDNYCCTICSGKWGGLNLDHVIPWSANGPDTSDNLRVLCGEHNEERSNFRETFLPRIVPVTPVCDPCLAIHDQLGGYDRLGARHRWATELDTVAGRACPLCRRGEFDAGDDRHPAYCGTCTLTSWVSDRGRLL